MVRSEVKGAAGGVWRKWLGERELGGGGSRSAAEPDVGLLLSFLTGVAEGVESDFGELRASWVLAGWDGGSPEGLIGSFYGMHGLEGKQQSKDRRAGAQWVGWGPRAWPFPLGLFCPIPESACSERELFLPSFAAFLLPPQGRVQI